MRMVGLGLVRMPGQMPGRMHGRRRAALAIDPAGVTVDVVLLLPDRHAMLDFIDDESAGAERLVTMHRADADPDRDVADGQRADAMYAGGARHTELLDRGLHDACAFLLGELRERLVLEARDRVAFVVIAHPAFEGGEAAALFIAQLALQGGGIERRTTEREGAHPPATGGMNTTASPALSGCDHSPNSALMATRSISAGRVNGYFAASSEYSSRGVRARVASVSALRPACSRSSAY